MKLIVITTSHTTENEGWKKLKASLDKFGYQYQHIIQPFSFGHQLPIVRDWCNKYTGDCTHIVYVDAFDNVAFAGPAEVISKFPDGIKMLISGEKNCYPHPERASDYPESNTPWKYVNGGGWMVEIEYFKELCRKENLTDKSHDQVWLMDAYLRNHDTIAVDTSCRIFQTIAFSYPEEWHKEGGRFQNLGTQEFPVYFHGNGHTEMNWLYNE